MAAYNYNLYDNKYKTRRHIMTIEAASPADAIKKAGFDWIPQDGGKIEKTRRGRGYTNTAIFVSLPETVAAGAGPDWTFERVF